MCSKPHKFFTRHTHTGILNHVDGAAVAISGYLPQDMLGSSIFDFYHPEDMSFLKEVYETIMKEAHKTGSSFHSKPYRFLINNGCYIHIETEWISFVNPWSKKLEFVIGHHRVLKGPTNPNVFAEKCFKESSRPEESLKSSKTIQEEILRLMEAPISRPSDTVKQVVSKRCQALASFMESLLGEVNRNDLQLEVQIESDVTFSERDSVMLGEISPHHDYFDSKSSSETPPSYNQLNYNENLQRFFDSRPVTTVLDESINKVESNDADTGTVQGFGESESGGNLSSGSNVRMKSITNASNTGTGTSSGSFHLPTLTQELLCKHNEDMEKTMIKKHKVLRTSNRMVDKVKKNPDKNQQDSQINHGHGVKRSGSHSWEGEVHKTSKHEHFPEARPEATQETTVSTIGNTENKYSQATSSRNVDLWPPFSVSLTTFHSSNSYITAPTVFPAVYYIPAQNQTTQNTPSANLGSLLGLYPPFSSNQAQIMYQPTMIYQPMAFQPLTTAANSQTNSAINFSVTFFLIFAFFISFSCFFCFILLFCRQMYLKKF